MKVCLNTCWAHPVYGGFRPGETVDVKSDVGKELIDGRYAKLVVPDEEEKPKKVGGRRGRTRGLVGTGD